MTYLVKPHISFDVVQNKNFVDHWAYEMEESDKNRFDRKFSENYLENLQPEDDSNEVGIDFFTDFDFIAGVNPRSLTIRQNDDAYLAR
ncbi:unnamed protein product [Euphydryas editha]|uniref:Uncharacterized protein n=1 Tax=Euphydryas editha TaxID=104508 RepID=A0AAU9TW31_EUPED|nr:unnamed protein product [Euphydryas editha]